MEEDTMNITPETYGPCYYCEWPITHIFFGWAEPDLFGRMEPACDLCILRLSQFRMFEDEEPAMAI